MMIVTFLILSLSYLNGKCLEKDNILSHVCGIGCFHSPSDRVHVTQFT